MKKEHEEVEVPSPAGICDECAENKRQAARCGNVIAIYCPHNLCGGVLMLDQLPRQWVLTTPIPQAAFVALTRDAVKGGGEAKEITFN